MKILPYLLVVVTSLLCLTSIGLCGFCLWYLASVEMTSRQQFMFWCYTLTFVMNAFTFGLQTYSSIDWIAEAE